MASITNHDDPTLIRQPVMVQRKPLMLKDYLREDMLSSCSSNGFKSFPRRQCCTTVRFLLELDLKPRDSPVKRHRVLRRSRSKVVASKTISVLRRASQAVINAVKKQLPFHDSVKSPSTSVRHGALKGLLPRSLSRKLFSRKNFWWKSGNKGSNRERWKSSHDIPNQQDKPSYQPAPHSRASAISSSHSNSWAESEFFTSEISTENGDVADGKTDSPVKSVSKRVGEAVGEDPTFSATSSTYSGANPKEWPNEEEKEQLSPVSVLDCPFEDDEEVSSPFESKLASIEGTKKKLMQKIRRFECLAQLEPVDLEKRFALSELNHGAPQSPMQASSISKESRTEQKAQELLDLIKATSSPHGVRFTAEDLLLDFFSERMEETSKDSGRELLKEAQDWLSGKPQELLQGWEVEDARKVYLKDMEKGGKWRRIEEKEEVASDVEVEVWSSLLDELLDDLF